MSFITPLPPISLLGRHRILSPTSAVRVSPLCLGGMNFGTAWSSALGSCSKEAAFALLDHFYQQGGNFIDTSVNYQFGESEAWIGEWMEERGVRDEIVLATKFTAMQITEREKEGGKVCKSNFGGNSRKNMCGSVERSLRALRTGYIDIVCSVQPPLLLQQPFLTTLLPQYYTHVWDSTCSIPELMHSLNDLVTARQVLYLGISDTPAWIACKANCYARQHGLRPFCIYQGRWSAADRSFEREIIPMCLDEGMALAPWGALGSGCFKTKAQREGNSDGNGGRNMAAMPPGAVLGNEEKVSDVLESVANRKNPVPPITSVALAYVMHKSPYVFPIVGGRRVEHLKENIEALGLRLSEEEVEEIDGAYGFEMGFPHQLLSRGNRAITGPEGNGYANNMVVLDHVKGVRAIVPFREGEGKGE
ncbi:Aldo keto reductase [Pyrenophora seminiperda CCB06]|uniref:Aldo keto reductase n=1 Tax=Pyrenophora seminiperda CCB06 TaxID=1302712 RepID=A0A3M7M6C1_9PLEO|nr:Aldo keto reductase [Pyrenophora seminiperda CCB06]